jgi:hypothetical protein
LADLWQTDLRDAALDLIGRLAAEASSDDAALPGADFWIACRWPVPLRAREGGLGRGGTCDPDEPSSRPNCWQLEWIRHSAGGESLSIGQALRQRAGTRPAYDRVQVTEGAGLWQQLPKN